MCFLIHDHDAGLQIVEQHFQATFAVAQITLNFFIFRNVHGEADDLGHRVVLAQRLQSCEERGLTIGRGAFKRAGLAVPSPFEMWAEKADAALHLIRGITHLGQ